MCCVPGASDDFAAVTHGLQVQRHHADGTEIVQDVFGGNDFDVDAGFGEDDVFRDVV